MRVLTILIIISLFSCKKDSEPSKSAPQDTRELVRIAHEKVGALNITYSLNKERAEEYLKKANNTEGLEKLNLLIQYSLEMINAGETRSAITTLDDVVNQAKDLGIDLKNDIGINLKSALAISYMRLGEQENCIKNHNHQSCIVPIKEEGIHTLTEGSTEAIKLFTEILEINPEHSQSIWLLNLAHMTLGTYPDGVPKSFLLDPAYFNKNKGKFPVFENIASSLGIDDNRLSGSSIIDDFDNDGDLDIIISSWGFNDQVKYYINNGKGGFDEMADKKGLTGVVGGLNINQTDYNNDGFLDLYIMRGAWMRQDGKIPNTLLKNNGDGSFTDVTIEAGLMKDGPTQASNWTDFNLDGWLDLVIFHESYGEFQVPSQLWINNRNGTFTDRANEAGLTHIQYFKGVSVDDLNNDGYPDMYVTTFGTNNLVYIHKGITDTGCPIFEEFGSALGLTLPLMAFPVFIFDFDNNGSNDIFVSSFKDGVRSVAASFTENVKGKDIGSNCYLYLNDGKGKFTDIHKQIGMTEAMFTMGCNYGDIDNDGFLDFYLGTGDPSFFSIVPNKLFLNLNGKGVEDVSYASGMAHIQKGHGISMADVDRDGDLDIYAVMGGAYEGDIFQNAFFENPGNGNNFIVLHLEGTKSNKIAIGARVKLVYEENDVEKTIFRTLNSGSSFGANSLELEIGLGQIESIKYIQILWPNAEKSSQVFQNIAINHHYKITEGNPNPEIIKVNKVTFDKTKMAHHH